MPKCLVVSETLDVRADARNDRQVNMARGRDVFWDGEEEEVERDGPGSQANGGTGQETSKVPSTLPCPVPGLERLLLALMGLLQVHLLGADGPCTSNRRG